MESNPTQGCFIVLEGTDGSGKATQLQLLADNLKLAGHDVAVFDFPQYDKPSSYFVSRYLNGAYGSAQEVGPYTGALFYALDRYDVADQIRQALRDGKIVLSNRYTASSMAHQGAKFDQPEQRRGYFIWLDNLEYDTLRIPRPQLNIVLHVPANTAQQLIDKKPSREYTTAKRDLHEADLDHMRQSVVVYEDLCQLFPKDFVRIDCIRGGQLLPVEQVSRLVTEKVQPYLPVPPARSVTAKSKVATPQPVTATPITEVEPSANTQGDSSNEPAIPEQFDAKTAAYYRDTLNSLRNRHATMLKKLTAYIGEHRPDAGTAAEQAAILLEAVKPVGSLADPILAVVDPASQQLIRKLPNTTYASATNGLSLLSTTPRNELDVITDLLYPGSAVAQRQLASMVQDWSYEQKSQAVSAMLAGPTSKIMAAIRYRFELVTDYSLLYELTRDGLLDNPTMQTLSPRLGYRVPKVIEDAGLTEHYEAAFDISLQLYSRLQQKGFDQQAQLAALAGHQVRWTVEVNAGFVARLLSQSQPETQYRRIRLGRQLAEAISIEHPLVAEHLARSLNNHRYPR